MDYGKLIFAIFVGVIEFAKAFGGSVDSDKEMEKARKYVADNDKARKAAQDKEDNVFSSTNGG